MRTFIFGQQNYCLYFLLLFGSISSTDSYVEIHFVVFAVIFLEEHLCQSFSVPPISPSTLPKPSPFSLCGQAQRSCYPWATGRHSDSSSPVCLQPHTPLPHIAKFWSKWVRKLSSPLGLQQFSAKLAVKINI